MDRFGPTGKVSKKRVHLLRWTNFPGRTGWNFGWMDRASLKTKSQTCSSYTMGSGNYPSRSNKRSTTEMCFRLCVPQAGLPWERPCFHLLTANNSATSGQGATAAVCGGKSGLKQGETRITIAKKVSITFKTGKLRQGFGNFTINIFFSRSISPL